MIYEVSYNSHADGVKERRKRTVEIRPSKGFHYGTGKIMLVDGVVNDIRNDHRYKGDDVAYIKGILKESGADYIRIKEVSL